MDAITHPPTAVNEPALTYRPGSAERESLSQRLKAMAGEVAELSMNIGGQWRLGGGERFDVELGRDHVGLGAIAVGRVARAFAHDDVVVIVVIIFVGDVFFFVVAFAGESTVE